MKQQILAGLAALALTASAADLPFKTTTIVNGQFAADTEWYAMQIGSQGYVIGASALETPITLTSTTANWTDAELWCFVGNETSGYTIYNKALGAKASLAAPVSPASDGNTGGNTFAQVVNQFANGMTYEWEFTPSTNISGTYYVSVRGDQSLALNKRGSNLAFWTTGSDAGSSIRILQKPCTDFTVANNVVTFDLGSGNTATLSCPGSTASANGKQLTLGAGTWTFTLPAGKVIENLEYIADGKVKWVSDAPWREHHLTIQGPAVIDSPELTLCDAKTVNGTPVFIYTGSGHYAIQYRIPAITTIPVGPHKGRLVAVNDYRYSGADIGAGRIDLHMSYSDDNGTTWSQPYDPRDKDGNTVAQGSGQGASNSLASLNCGYGDPAIVADRETGELLMVACCGRTGFFAGTRQSPQPSARWWSKDGGQTWTQPDYKQWEQIYALFDGTSPEGKIDSQFIGSGRIMQSRYVKVGTHYRLYAVMSGLTRNNGNIANWVLYSDDFGKNWHVLGDPMQPAVTTKGDEPKAEELPDGSVLLAARANGGGRHFNIFRYTDVAKAEGSWGTAIRTGMGFGNINACDGEIMILPVRNKATGAEHYIALQSFPFGGGRNNVSIAYKPLVTPEDYDQPTDFHTWEGRKQVSNIGSAYSTMTWTDDNKVGFFFEEQTYNNLAYTEIFVPLTIEEITGDKYEYVPDADKHIANRMTIEMMNYRAKGGAGKYVGELKQLPEGAMATEIAAFEANPTIDNIAAFNAALSLNGGRVEILPNAVYRFVSAHDGKYASFTGARYLAVTKTGKKINTNTSNTSQANLFTVIPTEGGYKLYNDNAGAYIPATAAATDTEMTATTNEAEAGVFVISSDITGHSDLVCTTPGNASYPAIHMAGTGKVVIWTAADSGSKWYMEMMTETAIDELPSTPTTATYYDLQGRRVPTPSTGQLLITPTGQKHRH